MNRREKILSHLNKKGLGLEIGPSHSPVAPKKEGFNVHIIDHSDQKGLFEKYKDLDVNVENIEEVDFVWKGGSYAELTGKKNYYDWIIASHVIEHVPDLAGFINSCDEVLKEDGIISLVIPDARYCFDHFRAISSLSSVIDAHLQKHKIHSPGAMAEYCLNIVKRDNVSFWSAYAPLKENYEFYYSTEEAAKSMTDSIESSNYIDCHRWCFTPNSFRLIIHDLYGLGLIKTKEFSFIPSNGSEIFMKLSRNGQGADINRLEMLKNIKKELAEDYLPVTFSRYLKNYTQRTRDRLGKIKHNILRRITKAN